MSRINTVDFDLVRGDDFTKTVVLRDGVTKAPVDVSAWTWSGQVREDPDAADPAVAEFDFELTDAADGLVGIHLAASDTETFNNRYYVYDLQIVEDGLTRTVARGRINIIKDVTRA